MSTNLKERNDSLTMDLKKGIDPVEVAHKYKLSLPYIRSLLRKEGNDHLLDGAKPRRRTMNRSNKTV